jgi:hypothetical protein
LDVTAARQLLDGRSDGDGVGAAARLTEADAAFDPLDGMMREQVQDADVLTGAAAWSEAGFQVAAEVSERNRQFPVAVDRSQIERGRFAL